ncbi:hypothetical protein G4G27_02105 [Sphingomonas sp. So64.6b]|uniref:hypothetical protein n=1 Tax=Sphingomonas sp. So64.6b TaxID=2997354 RepID=UPI001603E103|nr:hypothetical protein [Sphingomonas sp. So64.6b]QNA82938.1 hypothetical protein G4G27_02105 [Sphingomonas sp. So64.6b]
MKRALRFLPVFFLWTPPAWAGHAVAGARTRSLGGGGDLDISLGRIIISLVICIVIAGLAALLIKQRGGKFDLKAWLARIEPRTGEIRIVETRRLSLHADISVVRHGDREYLLLLQQNNAQILRERAFPQPLDAEQGSPCD